MKKTVAGLILGGIAAGAALALLPFRTPPIPGKRESIAVVEKVRIGGIDQWLMIRGEDRANPVVLFLHGGAGTSEMGLVRKHLGPLERDVTVVQWEQRGAGLSCTAAARASEFTVDRFVEDTLNVTAYLRERFGVERIYLVGHSWGSLLGMKAVQKRPDWYHAYIGTGQVSDFPRMELDGYRFALNAALADNNGKAVRQLREAGPPGPDGAYRDGMKGTVIERKWMTFYGGFARGRKSLLPMALENLLVPEYGPIGVLRFVRGMSLEKKNRMMEQEVMRISLPRDVPGVGVPVYFFLGRHDYNCSAEAASDYFEALEAPEKHLVWFEDSAHSPCFEEPEKFCRLLGEIVSSP